MIEAMKTTGLRNLTKIYDQNVFKWEKINNEKNFCISPVF